MFAMLQMQVLAFCKQSFSHQRIQIWFGQLRISTKEFLSKEGEQFFSVLQKPRAPFTRLVDDKSAHGFGKNRSPAGGNRPSHLQGWTRACTRSFAHNMSIEALSALARGTA